MTYSTEGEEVVLKSRMLEICKSGSVRGLVVDAVRRWPPALLDQSLTSVLSVVQAAGWPAAVLQCRQGTRNYKLGTS